MVKAAIRTLAEVEHRALTPAPYWKLPGANKVVPRLVEFNTDMDLLNSVLYPPAGGEDGRPRQRQHHAATPATATGQGAPPHRGQWPQPLRSHRAALRRPWQTEYLRP